MKRSQCKDGLEIYKRFLTRMTRVSEFFKIAEVKIQTLLLTQASSLFLRNSNGSLFSLTANGDRQKRHPRTHSGKTQAEAQVDRVCYGRDDADTTHTHTHSSRVQLGPIEPGSRQDLPLTPVERRVSSAEGGGELFPPLICGVIL